MRPLPLLLIVFVSTLAPAQADDVLVRYQKVMREPEAARTQLAPQLAAVPGARASAILRHELQKARGKPLQMALLEGLGTHGRPELADVVAEVLRPNDPDVQIAAAVGKALVAAGAAGAAPLQELITRFSTGRSNHVMRPSVFASLVTSLGQMTTPAGLTAAATLARKGNGADRWRVLATLAKADGAHGVHAARVEALEADFAPLVLEGLRQLATHDEAHLVVAMNTVAARAGGPLEDQLAAGLASLAAEVLRPELHAVFFTAAAASDPTLARGLQRFAKKLCADVALGRFVLGRAASLQSPRERALAARLVAAVPGQEATALLIELAQAREPEVADTAIVVLGARGDAAAVPALRKLLRSPGAERRRAAFAALHQLLRAEAEWLADLRAAVADAELRVLAVDLLAELADREFLAPAHGLLADPDWRVRAAAYDFCRRVRDAASVPILLERLAAEQDRMRQDVVDALVALTGQELRTEMQWRGWWQDHSAGFTLPPASAQAARKRSDPDAGSTRTYYSLPVVSAAVMFVVDRSGSMAATIGTGGGSNRLEEAKRQVGRVVRGTPVGHRLGVIAFDGGVQALQDDLVTISEKSRAALVSRVEALRLGGATNVHDALQAAFADPDIDTIYLLTDGDPSAGAITDPVALRAAVAQWNRTRRIRIHAISLGTDSAFMKGVAADSGGQYVSVR